MRGFYSDHPAFSEVNISVHSVNTGFVPPKTSDAVFSPRPFSPVVLIPVFVRHPDLAAVVTPSLVYRVISVSVFTPFVFLISLLSFPVFPSSSFSTAALALAI